MNEGIRMSIRRPVDNDATEIRIGYWDEKHKCYYVAENIVFKKKEEGICSSPAFILPFQTEQVFLRKLLSEIKENGLELNLEVEGELKATKYHLEDMRELTKIIKTGD